MASNNKELERLYGKPYITEDLLDVVVKTRKENETLHDDSFKIWERELSINEQRDLSELGRQVEKYSKDYFAVIVYVAIQNYPEMVFQLLMEEYLKNKERNKNNDSNSRSW